MKIIVDGDACPAKETILEIGKKENVSVVIIVSIAHWQYFAEGAQWITVDNYSQAVDMTIINKMEKNDLVVTDDYGLAAVVLGKGGYALSFRGKFYTEDKIDLMLEQRYFSQKIRRAGGHFKGPKAYTKADEENFKIELCNLISFVRKKLDEKEGILQGMEKSNT